MQLQELELNIILLRTRSTVQNTLFFSHNPILVGKTSSSLPSSIIYISMSWRSKRKKKKSCGKWKKDINKKEEENEKEEHEHQEEQK